MNIDQKTIKAMINVGTIAGLIGWLMEERSYIKTLKKLLDSKNEQIGLAIDINQRIIDLYCKDKEIEIVEIPGGFKTVRLESE